MKRDRGITLLQQHEPEFRDAGVGILKLVEQTAGLDSEGTQRLAGTVSIPMLL